MVNIKVTLPGFGEIDNPIIPASGTFGYGYEFDDYYDINILGTFSSKAITQEARFGNATPRVAETVGGMLNAIGLQNPGVDAVLSTELEKLKKVYSKKVLANVSGFSEEEFIEVSYKMSEHDMIAAVELNVSCPNVKKGGIAFGQEPGPLKALVAQVVEMSHKPVIVKLSPATNNIVKMVDACVEAGAAGVTLINTVPAMRIDVRKGKPILANRAGGLSGPAIKPIAVKMIHDSYKKHPNFPILASGGARTVDDVIELMMAGATAVQIGSENLVNPYICQELIEELPKRLEELGYSDINQIIGLAHR